MPDNEFTSAALIGHLISCTLLTKLVDRGVISAADVVSLVAESLLQLDEYESSFPEYQKSVEDAKRFLTILVKEYETDGSPSDLSPPLATIAPKG